MRIPILLDTDIGSDIDDAYALILAASSPELDLVAVTTVNNDVRMRAAIAMSILRLLSREGIPVAVGESRSLTPGETPGWLGIEGIGIDLDGIDPDRDFSPQDAVRLMASTAKQCHESGRPLTIISIGALTNLAVALERYPDGMAKARELICMASTFEGVGPENANPEHNVACDPVAASRVLQFGLPTTLVGLNVTRQTQMDIEDLNHLDTLGGRLADSLVGMHRAWFAHIGRNHSPMHDALAVACAIQPDLLKFRDVAAKLNPPSAAIEFDDPREGEMTNCRVADSVDVNAFHDLFFDRIHRAVHQSAMAHH